MVKRLMCLLLPFASTDYLLSMLGPGALLRHDPYRPPREPQWTAAWSGSRGLYDQGRGDGHTPREALLDAVRRRWGCR